MKINKFHELFEGAEMVMPDLDTLKKMYPDNANDAPHTLRLMYKADWERGKFKQDVNTVDSSASDDHIIDIQRDMSFKVSEILSVTLHSKDNSFYEKLSVLVSEYEDRIPKVKPGTKVINIDEPFMDDEGKIKKFRNPVEEEPSTIPKGAFGDAINGLTSVIGSAASGT